jgi:hypothetical protein
MFSDYTISHLRIALAIPDKHPHAQARLRNVVAQLCDEARVTGHHAEDLVGAIKSAWSDDPLPAGWSELEWRERYEQTLAWCISMYFDEPEPTS